MINNILIISNPEGDMVYLNEHFQPNDPGEAWDVKRKGVTVNPGVFAFNVIARFTDGDSFFTPKSPKGDPFSDEEVIS